MEAWRKQALHEERKANNYYGWTRAKCIARYKELLAEYPEYAADLKEIIREIAEEFPGDWANLASGIHNQIWVMDNRRADKEEADEAWEQRNTSTTQDKMRYLER